MDPELLKLAQGLGIDVGSMPGAAATGAADPKEPKVYFGVQERKVLPSRGGFKPDKARPVVTRETFKTLTEANAAFYEMEESDVAALQRRLVSAGILDSKKVRFGDYDDDTYSAFVAINERTARFNAVGKKFTPNDVLGMIERNAPPIEAERAEIRQGRVSRRSNPLELEGQVQQTAQQRLGRKLRKNEVQKFLTLYQGLEGQENARAMQAADQVEAGVDVTMTDAPSPGAAADQFLESRFAQEAAGQDAYGYLGALRSLIGG